MDAYYELARGYLLDYIKINTSNPPGNIEEAICFWKQIYEKENIRYEIYEHENGKKSICGFITDSAMNEKRVVLLNHMDVVPADEIKWNHPPFSGEADDQYIYGRGTIDMKGLAIVQFAVALYIRKSGFAMKRDLCILSVPDEETGGFFGAKFVVQKYLSNLNPFVVLDEGTFAIRKENINFFISYSQKKTLWLKICAFGKEGHGACPTQDNANNIIIRALEKLCRNPFYNGIELSGDIHSDVKMEYGLENILTHNTISITSILSQSEPNVKPKYAEAVLDCRLMPDTDVGEFIEQLGHEFDDERIKIQVIKRTNQVSYSKTDHEIIGFIKNAITKHVSNANVKTIVTPVGTDSKYFRDAGVDSYGFFPIILTLEELNLMHGTDEKLSLHNLKIAIDIYKDVLCNYAKEANELCKV